MTTFYLDPEGGNDANDGTTFANRWKTLTSGATAARTAPGDTIRLIASPAPVSIGATQWTDNSGVLTPTTSVNKVIDECDTAWTAATNVTATAATGHKTGSFQSNLAIAAGFTTGKVAYKALASTQDFSAFQQISLWFQSNVISSVAFDIKLCSDAVGDVPVDTLSVTLSNLMVAGQWAAVVLDKGSALSAGINSVAIYATADPGTVTWKLDNIVACKAPSASPCVTHLTLVGKDTVGEPEWYSLTQITDTTLVIGGSSQQMAAVDPARPYRGTTESVTSYGLNCIPGWTTAQYTLNEGGAAGSPITYSGGWDRTAMTTQSGETWISGGHKLAAFVSATVGIQFITMENIGIAHYGATGLAEVNHGWDVHILGIIGCAAAWSNQDAITTPTFSKVKIDQIWGHNIPVSGFVTGAGSLEITRIHGFTDTAALGSAFEPFMFNDFMHDYRIGKIDNSATSGIGTANGPRKFRLKGTIFANNATSDIVFFSTSDGELLLDACQLLSATAISYNGTGLQNSVMRETNIGGDATLHKLTFRNATAKTQSAVARSGVAWQLSPTSANYYSVFPFRIPLGSIAVNANKLVTIKCWVRRDNTGISAGLYLLNAALPGVVETSVLMTAAANTWEEITITCTPTSAGVLTFYGIAYGGTTFNAYFDDLTITQAT